MSEKITAPNPESVKELRHLRMAVLHPYIPGKGRDMGEQFAEDLYVSLFNIEDSGVKRTTDVVVNSPVENIQDIINAMCSEVDVVHIVLPSNNEIMADPIFKRILRGVQEFQGLLPRHRKFFIPVRLTNDPMPSMFEEITPIDIDENNDGAFELRNAWIAVSNQKSQEG